MAQETKTLTQLASELNVDLRTFEKMIKPIEWKMRYKQERRRILVPKEVQMIREHLCFTPD